MLRFVSTLPHQAILLTMDVVRSVYTTAPFMSTLDYKKVLLSLSCFSLISCAPNIERLPSELKLNDSYTKILNLHTFGPSGINEGFIHYRLPEDVAQNIKRDGIAYLNSIDHSVGGGEWMDYDEWLEPPMEKNSKWLRQSYSVEPTEQLHLSEFYGDALIKNDPYLPRYEFSGQIPSEIRIRLSEILSGVGLSSTVETYYSYGGYRDKSLLILLPSYETAYYLYRD